MSVFELQPASPELALPLPHVRALLVELEDEDVELALQHVDLAFGQLLLPASEQLLLRLLLQGSAAQLLFPGPQLLRQSHTARCSAGERMAFWVYCPPPAPAATAFRSTASRWRPGSPADRLTQVFRDSSLHRAGQPRTSQHPTHPGEPMLPNSSPLCRFYHSERGFAFFFFFFF